MFCYNRAKHQENKASETLPLNMPSKPVKQTPIWQNHLTFESKVHKERGGRSGDELIHCRCESQHLYISLTQTWSGISDQAVQSVIITQAIRDISLQSYQYDHHYLHYLWRKTVSDERPFQWFQPVSSDQNANQVKIGSNPKVESNDSSTWNGFGELVVFVNTN